MRVLVTVFTVYLFIALSNCYASVVKGISPDGKRVLFNSPQKDPDTGKPVNGFNLPFSYYPKPVDKQNTFFVPESGYGILVSGQKALVGPLGPCILGVVASQKSQQVLVGHLVCQDSTKSMIDAVLSFVSESERDVCKPVFFTAELDVKNLDVSQEKQEIYKEQKDAQRPRLREIKNALEKAGFVRSYIKCQIYSGTDWAMRFPQEPYLAARDAILVDVTKNENSIVPNVYSICPSTALYGESNRLLSTMRYTSFLLTAHLKRKKVDGSLFDKKTSLTECQLLTVADLQNHLKDEVEKRKSMSEEQRDERLRQLLTVFVRS